jgi:type VI secretion system protein ImpG
VERILVRDPSKPKLPTVTLAPGSIRPVGFAADEGMLPHSHSSFIGHYLLLEYFAFPEKFFFVDLMGLEKAWPAGFQNNLEIIFLLSDVAGDDRRQRLELELSKDTFRLGCVPVVNLFPQTAEPIQLNQRKYEYPIVPDVRRPYAMEVYSVDQVSCINTSTQQTATFQPFYSLTHSARNDQQQCYWLATRRPTNRPNDEGTDVYVSLMDLSMRHTDPEGNILSIRTTCTNRELPSRLPIGRDDGDFELEGFSSLKRIVALRKPTGAVRPPTGKAVLWRLISHLSLNYLSLVDEGKEALQQILRLYDVGRSAYSRNVIDSILRVQSGARFARVSSENGVTFARGKGVELELDEDQFVGGGAFLFASVIERFLGLNSSLNSFTQLTAKTQQRKEVLHQWPPRAGRKVLI